MGSASVKDWELLKLLKKLAAVTQWKIYVEQGTSAEISVKFKNLNTDEALSRLLNKVNYAKIQTNGATKLIVYRTVATAANVLVEAPKNDPSDHRIPNELIVRLKRDSTESIDEIAKALGAKVVGRNDKLKLYRLQFGDAAATDAATTQLEGDPSVAFVDSNYVIDPPKPIQSDPAISTANGSVIPPSLLNPKTPVNGLVIGLVDTAVQIPDQLQQFSAANLSVVGQTTPSTSEITHGTSMFETLIEGMADAPSKILSVNIYPSGESTTTFEGINGIAAAINNGANLINLSWGGTGDSQALAALIAEGSQKGVLFVAASGNTPGTALTYPAAYPGVLAVTASDPNGQLAAYANDGAFVRAMAPGTSTVSLNGQSWIVQGTSTATAFATSAIAQLANQQHITVAQAITQFIQSHPPPKH